MYTAATGGAEMFTLSGVANTDGISISGKTVTLPASSLSESDITISNSEYKLALENIAEPIITAANLNGNVYTSESKSAGYTLADNKVTYAAEIPAKTFTLSGLNSSTELGENLLVTDGATTNFKFKAVALNKESVTISGGTFSVELDGDVDTTVEEISESKVLTFRRTSRAAVRLTHSSQR